jgi:hypothetical protein
MPEQIVDINDPTTYPKGKLVRQEFVKQVPVPALYKAILSLFPEIVEGDTPTAIIVGQTVLSPESDVTVAIAFTTEEGDTDLIPGPPGSFQNPNIRFPGPRPKSPGPPEQKDNVIRKIPEGYNSLDEFLEGTNE